MFIGGDQSPLRQGFLRAATIQAITSGPIRYFIHDADKIGHAPVSAPGLTVYQDTQSTGVWLAVEWDRPFLPLPIQSAKVQRWVRCNRKRAKQLARWFRKRYGSYRRGLIYGGQEPYIAASLRPDQWPALHQLAVEEFEQEIAWALKFTHDPQATCRADEIITSVKSQQAIVETNINLARTIFNDLYEISTSTHFWQLRPKGGAHFSLLEYFLQDPEALTTYNTTTGSTGLPFWVIQEDTQGRLIRNPLTTQARSISELFQELGSAPIVPKALPLLIQLRSLGKIFFTHLAYLPKAAHLANVLGVHQEPAVKITFYLKECLGNLWPAELDFWPAVEPETDFELRQVLVANAKAEALAYWRKRPTLLFAWVVGGNKLIQDLIDTATIKVIKS